MIARLDVRVQPRARRDEVAGARAGRVVIRVTAPPADGRANAAVCKLVAEAVGVPPSAVTVVRGRTARDKTLQVAGVDDAALRDAFE